MQRLEKIWAQNAAPKKPEWPSYGNFGKVTQNPHFLKKEQRADQGKFSKNRPKKCPPWKGPKAHWRKWHYPLVCTHLKCKHWKTFWRKQRLQRVPEWPSYGNFKPGDSKPAFFEKVQRRDQGKFFKNRPKSSPRLKSPKAFWRKWYYPLIKVHLKCKDWKTFCRNQRLQKCLNSQVMAILTRSPKSRIFWKSANGRPREIFQKSPKKMPSLKRPKSTLAQMALSSN